MRHHLRTDLQSTDHVVIFTNPWCLAESCGVSRLVLQVGRSKKSLAAPKSPWSTTKNDQHWWLLNLFLLIVIVIVVVWLCGSAFSIIGVFCSQEHRSNKGEKKKKKNVPCLEGDCGQGVENPWHHFGPMGRLMFQHSPRPWQMSRVQNSCLQD